MKCPFCGHLDTQVVDSRVSEDASSIRRRRRCLGCDKRFTTFETAELRMPQVVKQDGHRAEFDEDKLRIGFNRALHKRPVSTQLVDESVEHIKQKLLALGEREVSARELGEMVMSELARLDKVAYIRFASVYRSFQDVSEFSEAIREISRKQH
ncbi:MULTISPECIES: transcriptional regulator NrdR [Microvirgula]|uniref:Transcriptional repressor NrdR n=1 Tax=Microvirgula aerodenitrificans TaxID=57480 RepID=A0A2U3THP5_9NEIS|nr:MULTISPECIES: transcriptional regulator NrdR [Microvirgula]AVY92945.1 transcriptional repressor NrdR [Microvirgula aerodenitrificans]RAS17723.1 transcriptional repressor NrdR [Microvirgula sp. AG722]